MVYLAVLWNSLFLRTNILISNWRLLARQGGRSESSHSHSGPSHFIQCQSVRMSWQERIFPVLYIYLLCWKATTDKYLSSSFRKQTTRLVDSWAAILGILYQWDVGPIMIPGNHHACSCLSLGLGYLLFKAVAAAKFGNIYSWVLYLPIKQFRLWSADGDGRWPKT